MKILALETSAGPASCAVVENGVVLASAYNNTALTHSQTLLPMTESMLQQAGIPFRDIDCLAVAAGPGSFTGVRIGVAALKGLAFAHQKPCVAVSTLAAIARNAHGIGFEGIACAVMDARCCQVYTACFDVHNGQFRRISEDEAISTDELKAKLSSFGNPILLLGDGAKLCYNEFANDLSNVQLAAEHIRFQTAIGVAVEAAHCDTVTADVLQPIYLRLPQAERELRARTKLAE